MHRCLDEKPPNLFGQADKRVLSCLCSYFYAAHKSGGNTYRLPWWWRFLATYQHNQNIDEQKICPYKISSKVYPNPTFRVKPRVRRLSWKFMTRCFQCYRLIAGNGFTSCCRSWVLIHFAEPQRRRNAVSSRTLGGKFFGRSSQLLAPTHLTFVAQSTEISAMHQTKSTAVHFAPFLYHSFFNRSSCLFSRIRYYTALSDTLRGTVNHNSS